MIDGIPADLHNLCKKAQLGKKAIDHEITRSDDANLPAFDENITKRVLSTTLVNELTPIFNQLGFTNNDNVIITDPGANRRGAKQECNIDLNNYIRIEISAYANTPVIGFAIVNLAKHKAIKKVQIGIKTTIREDQIAAIRDLLVANRTIWQAALSSQSQSPADSFLNHEYAKKWYARIRNEAYATDEWYGQLAVMYALTLDPGNMRKKAIQTSLELIQKYAKDKDFINADVSARLGSDTIWNQDGTLD